jgi:hypothetical protein
METVFWCGRWEEVRDCLTSSVREKCARSDEHLLGHSSESVVGHCRATVDNQPVKIDGGLRRQDHLKPSGVPGVDGVAQIEMGGQRS